MMGLRNLIYRCGFRPKPGSIFFSPWLDMHYKAQAAIEGLVAGYKSRFLTANEARAIYLDSNGDAIPMNPCRVCGKVDSEKAMVFRGTNWCCEIHRKVFTGEIPMDDPVNLAILAGES